jgi:hypothetical protein
LGVDSCANKMTLAWQDDQINVYGTLINNSDISEKNIVLISNKTLGTVSCINDRFVVNTLFTQNISNSINLFSIQYVYSVEGILLFELDFLYNINGTVTMTNDLEF